MDNLPTSLKNALIEFFENGDKSGMEKCLGVEIEHFIVDKNTRQAIPYEGVHGVREILEQLSGKFPDVTIPEQEDLFGFETKEFTITLEPAAQIEISIAPRERIADILDIYERFLDALNPLLRSYDYELLNVGCQPVSSVRSLKLIPKERYHYMDLHFQKVGTGGVEMMRGSASVQISIDYRSEEDFRRKIQAISLLTPVFQLLNDNSKQFEGKPVSGHMKRADIWRRTDADRTGILPGVFSDTYGFADYAQYLCDMPLIFIQTGHTATPTGMQTAAEVYADRTIDEEAVRHVLSMAFPDVRLKNYLEIRSADSVPQDRMLAYCAFVKGILYQEKGLAYLQQFIREHQTTVEAVERSRDSLMENGFDGIVYDVPVREFVKKLLVLAKEALPQDEQQYLSPYEAMLQ